jgi:hypothetical protein
VRGTRALLRILGCCAALALWAPPAHAGVYDVWSCRGPDGSGARFVGWTPYHAIGPGMTFNTCGEPNGGLGATLDLLSTVPPGTLVGWMFQTPEGLTIDNYTLFRWLRAVRDTHNSGRDYWLYFDEPVWNAALESPREACVARLPVGCGELGALSSPYAAASRADAQHLTIKRLLVLEQCDSSLSGCDPTDALAEVIIMASRVGLRDSDAPTFASPPTGSLLESGGVLNGERSVRVRGQDVGGGVARIAVVVDGSDRYEQPVNAADEACRVPYTTPVPCPLAVDSTLAFDTATLPNGAHKIQVALIDAAGNRSLTDPVAVETRNGGRPNGVGASRSASLKVGIGPSERARASRTVSFGRRATVHGVLTSGGQPISGAAVEVTSTDRRLGARGRTLPPLITDAQGRFTFAPSAGASRIFEFAYRAFTLEDPVARSAVRLNVRAGVRLRLHPHRVTTRGRIVFEGRLLGGPGRRGTQVGLFAVARRGRDQVPVATLQADRRGRFRFSYRFRRTFAPFTYYFQAIVQRQNGYPYATGRSKRVSVRIVR